MIAGAKSSIVLATFDLRADESGTDVMAALYDAAERGVKVRLLIDGIYEIPMLRGNATFRTLASHPNVDARIYNPVSFRSLLRLNYRMHDKYLMVDHARYLLGGRNTNHIFLGKYRKTINIDRDLLVVSEDGSEGNSLQELCCYFEKIWQEPCVKKAADFVTKKKEEQQKQVLKERYQKWKQKDSSMGSFDDWNGCTEPVEEIHLLSNGTEAKRSEKRASGKQKKDVSDSESHYPANPSSFIVFCRDALWRKIVVLWLNLVIRNKHKSSFPESYYESR